MNKVIAKFLATFLVSSSLLSCAPQVKKIVEEKKEEVKVVKKEIPLYPVPKKVPEQKNYNGETYTDDYSWLRNKENPEVIAHLEAENKHTEMMMKSTESIQDSLFKEMVARIKEDDSSVPQKIADYYYYSRTEQGKQYRIYCRKGKLATAKEEITLDLNTLVKGDFLALGDYKVSPNQKMLAYTLDNNGSEAYDLYIKNLETGELFKEVIPNTSGNIEWSSDNKTIFYATLDSAKRPFKVFKHKLATEFEKDTLVYHETDESYYLGVSKTKNGAYILLNSGSQVTSEVRFINATKPDEMPKIVTKREYGVEYSVENRDNKFFIVTNKDAVNFKLVVTSIDKPSIENWREVIPAWETIKIDDFQVFKDYIVVLEREAALKKILIINLKNFESKYIEFEEPVYNVELAKNPEYTSPNLRFTYESLTTPESVFEYEFATGKKNLLKRQEVLGGYDPSNYEAERGFASSPDGVTVPISIVHKKGLEKNGNNPVYLYAYGSYGSNMDPYFSSARLSLLDRGFVFAIAHIRGGGDLGRRWYEDGKFLKKKNTFVDFISSAEYLIKENYTSKDKLVISGGSAGGLLMGAVTNMRPDLFKGVVADVPFVDVINTMMDPTLPLTVIEYDEWGNPNQKEYYDYMKSYSPYDNVKPQAYPNMLVTAGLNDPRVGYWEPAKFVAKIREMRTDKNLIMLKTNMGAGHGGASGRYDYLKDTAFEYAFALKVTGGIPEPIATPVPSETPTPIATPIPTPSAN